MKSAEAGTDQPSPRRLPQAARIGIVLGSLFVVLFALVLVLDEIVWRSHQAEKRRVQVEIKSHLAALRAAGVPLTAEDLARLYPDPPPEQDANLLLTPAFEAMVKPGTTDELSNLPDFPKGTNLLDAEIRKEVVNLIGLNQSAIEAVPLPELGNAWFGLHFSNGLTNTARLPYKQLRRFTLLVCWKAVLEGEDGNAASAGHSLNLAMGVSHTMRSQVYLEELVRVGNESQVSKALESVLNHSQLGDTQLASMATAFGNSNPQGLKEIFRNQLPVSMLAFELMRPMAEKLASRTRVPFARFYFESLSRRLYSDAEYLQDLEQYERQMEALKLPFKECESAFKKEAKDYASGRKQSMAARMSGLDFSSLRSWTTHSAHRKITLAALAVERWRLAHDGRSPESLADLVPDYLPKVPVDPFDEKPIRYKQLSPGYLIYSVGQDLQDNGGRSTGDDGDDSDPWDITFTVQR